MRNYPRILVTFYPLHLTSLHNASVFPHGVSHSLMHFHVCACMSSHIHTWSFTSGAQIFKSLYHSLEGKNLLTSNWSWWWSRRIVPKETETSTSLSCFCDHTFEYVDQHCLPRLSTTHRTVFLQRIVCRDTSFKASHRDIVLLLLYCWLNLLCT